MLLQSPLSQNSSLLYLELFRLGRTVHSYTWNCSAQVEQFTFILGTVPLKYKSSLLYYSAETELFTFLYKIIPLRQNSSLLSRN